MSSSPTLDAHAHSPCPPIRQQRASSHVDAVAQAMESLSVKALPSLLFIITLNTEIAIEDPEPDPSSPTVVSIIQPTCSPTTPAVGGGFDTQISRNRDLIDIPPGPFRASLAAPPTRSPTAWFCEYKQNSACAQRAAQQCSSLRGLNLTARTTARARRLCGVYPPRRARRCLRSYWTRSTRCVRAAKVGREKSSGDAIDGNGWCRRWTGCACCSGSYDQQPETEHYQTDDALLRLL